MSIVSIGLISMRNVKECIMRILKSWSREQRKMSRKVSISILIWSMKRYFSCSIPSFARIALIAWIVCGFIVSFMRNFIYSHEEISLSLLKKSLMRKSLIEIPLRTLSPIGTNVVQSVFAKNMLFHLLFKEKAEEVMNECL